MLFEGSAIRVSLNIWMKIQERSRLVVVLFAGGLLWSTQLFGQEEFISRIVDGGELELLYSEPFSHLAQSASPAQLRVLRNLVYAAHGRPFNSADLRERFGAFEWYTPSESYSDALLSEYDRLLLAYILFLEGGDWIDFMTDGGGTVSSLRFGWTSTDTSGEWITRKPPTDP